MSVMRAAVVTSEGLQVRADHPRPEAGPAEALVKVLRVGICNTDLEILKGYQGFQGVLGHEFLGIVESVMPYSKVAIGDRVVGEINLPKADCDCSRCQQGGIAKRNHCANRAVLGILNKDGTFAEYLTLPVDNLLIVPPQIPDERAVFAEPLAAAFRILEQGLVKHSDKVAVIGDGKLGLLIAMVMVNYLSQDSSQVVLFGRHPDKMALLASDNLHLSVVVDATTEETYKDVFDVCIEASGTPTGIHMASAITRPIGCLVLKSTCALGTDFNTAPFVIKELSVVGSRCGNFPMALDALQGDKFPVEKLIVKVYPFSEIAAAVEHAGKKGTLKIQVIMDGDN